MLKIFQVIVWHDDTALKSSNPRSKQTSTEIDLFLLSILDAIGIGLEEIQHKPSLTLARRKRIGQDVPLLIEVVVNNSDNWQENIKLKVAGSRKKQVTLTRSQQVEFIVHKAVDTYMQSYGMTNLASAVVIRFQGSQETYSERIPTLQTLSS